MDVRKPAQVFLVAYVFCGHDDGDVAVSLSEQADDLARLIGGDPPAYSEDDAFCHW